MEYQVLLVESDRLMLERLANVIKETIGFKLAARYQSPSDALGQGAVFNPNLILLDIENNPISTLEDFKKVYPGISIVCMGEHWQADTASHLVRSGARGYLMKPFTSNELIKSLETFNRISLEGHSQVITFFSPKGKSGKTTLLSNLAVSLARKTGEPIGIIDADLQFGDMAVFFNVEPKSTIVEAVRDIDFLSPVSLNGYFVPVTEKISLLCGTRTPNLSDKVEIDPFLSLLTMAKSLFRYVLVDVPQGFCPISIAAAEASDLTYVVAMVNGGYEVRHVQRALQIFDDWEDASDRVKTVFTRVNPCDASSQRFLEDNLERPVEAIIPSEYVMVSAAADNGHMALDLEPGSQLAMSINLLADRLLGRKQIRWDEL